jgi:hypothetical protein
MSEQIIQQNIMLALGRRTDLRIWRQNTGTARSHDGKRVIKFGVVGGADISGLLRGGRRLEIEVKAPGGVQSEDQKRFQQMIERFGGVYLLVYSVEQAVTAIDGLAA